MPEPTNLDPEPRYHETSDPQNPPKSVLKPAARRSAVWAYVGGIAVVFLIVAAMYAYQSSTTSPRGDSELDVTEPTSVGTGGQPSNEDSPGGFDPAPDRETTESELEFRGATGESQGPMPGLTNAEPLTELGAMLEDSPQTVAGRRIDVQDVNVESVDGNTIVIRDGDARASVVTSGASEVRAGQRVDVSGTVEPDGQGSARIRATRVNAR